MISVLFYYKQKELIFEICCRKFEVTSPEQTRLYYKYKNDWKLIVSILFVLIRYKVKELDEYVFEYTIFYLTKFINKRFLFSQVFIEIERNIKVNTVSNKFTTKLKFFLFQNFLM